MARIRSVHPGLFTDDSFVSVSDAAQIFYIGLLTEADDNGVFEWNALKLKMRLRPASTQQVDGLLEELVNAERIAPYEAEGRKLGAIRNFRKYQRPKFPKSSYPLPAEWGNYVGLSQSATEIEGVEAGSIPRNAEKSPQMEDGEGIGEGERKKGRTAGAVPSPSKYAFESGVIRLNEKDLAQFKRDYSYLDVPAELLSFTEFAQKNSEKWFFAIQGALAKRNREVKAKVDAAPKRPNGGWA